MTYPLADRTLARRFEAAIVEDLIGYITTSRAHGLYPDGEYLRVAGGVALWLGPDHVINGAFGMGMRGEVEQEEVAAMTAFFAERGTVPKVDVCPLVDPSLLRWLAAERFVASEFEMVLYQPLPAATVREPAEGVTVRIAITPEERERWADLEARGFLEGVVSDEAAVFARAIGLRDDSLHFLGYLDGEPAGTGMLTMRDGLAMFNGDSTLPEKRGRGVQSTLLAARLAHASAAGCDLAMIEAAPGGISLRNQERAGFRVAYNRVSLVRPE